MDQVQSESQGMEIHETIASANMNQPIPENPKEVRLVDVEVTNENIALNLLVSFINVAHKRGVYSLDEAAKIWECIKMFQR